MQQWSRNYLQMAHGRTSDQSYQAHIQAFMFDGISTFRASATLGVLPFFLHLSLFLFLAGMVDFLFSVHDTVAFVVLGFVSVLVSIYGAFTVLPLIFFNFPYPTPLSRVVWHLSGLFFGCMRALHKLALAFKAFWVVHRWDPRHVLDAWYSPSRHIPAFYNRYRNSIKDRLIHSGSEVHGRALGKLLVQVLDTVDNDAEVEIFFEGIHTLLLLSEYQPAVSYWLNNDATYHPSFQRLLDGTDGNVPELVHKRRSILAMRVLWAAFKFSKTSYDFLHLITDPFAIGIDNASSRTKAVDHLLEDEDATVATTARCVQAIAAQDFLALSETTGDSQTLSDVFGPPLALQESMNNPRAIEIYGRSFIIMRILGQPRGILRPGDPSSDDAALMISEVVSLLTTWQRRLTLPESSSDWAKLVRRGLSDTFSQICEAYEADAGVADLRGAIADVDPSSSWKDFWRVLRDVGVKYGSANLIWALRRFAMKAFGDVDLSDDARDLDERDVQVEGRDSVVDFARSSGLSLNDVPSPP
ncbi:hypothetical protein BC834DRAFT_127549 [Gloeopeniophorella convolvens]|nr:hypothetical protein BC834DRAFT_127549 [Gloeopeniophorella convolvens]